MYFSTSSVIVNYWTHYQNEDLMVVFIKALVELYLFNTLQLKFSFFKAVITNKYHQHVYTCW